MLLVVLALATSAMEPPSHTDTAASTSVQNWTVLNDFFCHPHIADNRLIKNSTISACIALCEADPACVSVAFTNANAPTLSWCFAPEEDCPNPTGRCDDGCQNWDTYVKPGVGPFPSQPLFHLSETITSHMVLQRQPANTMLWGWGDLGTVIVLSAGDFSAKTSVAADGRWSITLPPQPEGLAFGTGNVTLTGTNITTGKSTIIRLVDVVFGEVWLCTGQSNMGVGLNDVGKGSAGHLTPLTSWSGDVTDGASEIANSSNYPYLRVVHQSTAALSTPTEHASVNQGWYRPAPETISKFSAVCWMFGRHLHEHLGIPVGLVQNQVGGTAVELWSSQDALSKCDQSRGPDKMAVCKQPNEGQRDEPMDDTDRNSTLYNGMIAPWLNMSARGAIWYQGESNVACSDVWEYMQGTNCAMNASACADYYSCQFPAMIEDWRSKFASNGNNFTFLYVGLPAYVEDLPSTLYDGKNDTSLPLLRLAQRTASELPATAMTSLIDHGYLFGHIGSIHPMDKLPVGKRLMLAAREHAYGEMVISTGPEPISAKTNTSLNAVELTFDPQTVGSNGLLLRLDGVIRQTCVVGEKQMVGNPINITVPRTQCGSATGFEIEADGVWYPIESIKQGELPNVLVLLLPLQHTDLVRNAVSLRYLFADWPTPTVYNAQSFLGLNGELPTAPFMIKLS